MQIGDVAAAAGVSAKTIRYYEEVGVLPPARRAPNGYRIYGPDTVDRLRFIKDAQATGLTLDEIASVLELRRRGASTCRHVLGLLERHQDELDIRIAVLERTRKELSALIARARQVDPADCTDPHRCQTITPPAAARAPARRATQPGPHRH